MSQSNNFEIVFLSAVKHGSQYPKLSKYSDYSKTHKLPIMELLS